MKTNPLENKLNAALTKIINPKIGVVVGTINSTYAYLINANHGFDPAILAAGKQFAFSFFIGGFIGKICQYCARIENKYIAWSLGEIVPFIVANSLLYTIHKLSGTPEPLNSLILPSIIGTFCYSPPIIYLTRKGHLK
jgi:hypothetical protein